MSRRFLGSSLGRSRGLPWLLGLALFSNAALAQSTTPAPLPATGTLSESLKGMAKADYAAAKILYEDGDFQGAIQKLKSSYEASKDARLLWNMAACEKNLRHYAEVARLVDRYLAEGGALVSEQDRADAVALVSTVKSFVTTLTVDVDQAGAVILMDEQPLGKSPLAAPLQVDMGVHKIRVTKAGFVDFTTAPELPGGQPFHVFATMVPERHEGRLRVLAGPSEVIQIDRGVSNVGLWEGTLPSGTHSVYVSAKGKRPHQTDVIVQDNNLTNLHITLEDESPLTVQKSSVPAWVWIAGSAVLVGGGVGAYFLLKPDSATKYQSPTPGTWGAIDI
jgi:hypothetical protein